MRPKHLYFVIALVVIVLAALVVVIAPTFASRPLLSSVTVQPSIISPNGDGIADETTIDYSISKRASVRATLTGADGTAYVLREAQDRAPDSYQIRFNGAIAVPGSSNYRVLPDGIYQGTITVTDDNGVTASQTFDLTIQDADSTPPAITDLVCRPNPISPNGDAYEDEMIINYALSKKAELTIYVTDSEGNYSLLDPPEESDATLRSFTWTGTENGGRLLADGIYTLHILAKDTAGNITEETAPVEINNSGTPRLEITKAKFTPTTIPLGGKVHVEITVKNTGDTIIKWDELMGPYPGTEYDTTMTFGYWQDETGKPKYYERNGVWRVGVTWTNVPIVYPVRWAIGKTLAPGEETTITGDIVVKQRDQELYFAAGVEQGGVGFPGGQTATTKVVVSY